jgi:hypothetical protein
LESRLNAGQVNQLAVLNAQQTYLTAAVIRVQTEANRLADTAALFLALGGGWPATCTTPVWRKCAMGEGPPPISESRRLPSNASCTPDHLPRLIIARCGAHGTAFEPLRLARTSGGETNDQRNEGG